MNMTFNNNIDRQVKIAYKPYLTHLFSQPIVMMFNSKCIQKLKIDCFRENYKYYILKKMNIISSFYIENNNEIKDFYEPYTSVKNALKKLREK